MSEPLTKTEKDEIASKLFELANKLGGDETGHLASIIHSVVSELMHGVDVWTMLDKVRANEALIRALKAQGVG